MLSHKLHPREANDTVRPPSRARIRHYSRRQRKKLFVGEFAHSGAELRVVFIRPVEWDAVIDDFISTVTSVGLEAAGFGSRNPCLYIEGAVIPVGTRQDAEMAFTAAADELRTHPLVGTVQITSPCDLWWGQESDEEELPPFTGIPTTRDPLTAVAGERP